MAAAILLLAAAALTNRWMSFASGMRLVQAHDERSYRVIAGAAPSLPSEHLPIQHAERWPVHWLVGSLADLFGVSLDTAYRVAMAIAVVAVVGVVALVIRRLAPPGPASVLCVALFVLSPYALRYYGLAPAMLADLVFVLGVAVASLGLVERRGWVVCAGLLVAVLGRQTAVPVLIAVAIWLLAEPRYGTSIRARVGVAAAVVLPPAVLAVVVQRVARPFASDTVPGFTHFTIMHSLSSLPGSAGDVGEHLARTFFPLLGAAALLTGVVLVLGRLRGLRPEVWGFVGIAASIVVQPLVLSPGWAARNETRLSALALAPMAFALAAALGQLGEGSPGALRTRTVAILVALLAIGSFHHLYTVIGPGSVAGTSVLQPCVAVALLVTIVLSEGVPGRAPAARVQRVRS